MKKIVPFIILLTVILSGCGSAKKQLERGNYDAAIDKAVKQLRKDPSDAKEIEILQRSYTVANDRDNERIRFLKMEGTPLKPRAFNKRIEGVRSFLKHLALKGYVLRTLVDAICYVKEPKMLPTVIMTNMQT